MFGRVKLCGLNCGADVRAARPAAFAGFVFVPGSPRHVTADEAAPLAGLPAKLGMLPVGVFRDAPLRAVADTATLLNLHAVQLHGREDANMCARFAACFPDGCEIWTALSVGRDAAASRGGDRLLFDNGDGGSGQAFDWSLVAEPSRARPCRLGRRDRRRQRASRTAARRLCDRRRIGGGRAAGTQVAEKIAALFDALRPVSRERLRACA